MSKKVIKFFKKSKQLIPKRPDFYFEPKEPITNKIEFTNELIAYCKMEEKDLTILHEGMNPVASIDGVRYMGSLETPRFFSFPFSIFFVGHTYGFRFAYFYKY